MLICSDSQSLCIALRSHNHEVAALKARFLQSAPSVTVQWIPGHSDIAGNELADQAAKDASTLQTKAPNPIPYKSVCAAIKSQFTDTIQHERTKQVYAAYSRAKDREATKTRSDQVLLGRIRSGHFLGFNQYQHRIGKSDDPTCGKCDAPIHDLEHWFRYCPALSTRRHRLFGSHRLDLEALTSNPQLVLAYARATLTGCL